MSQEWLDHLKPGNFPAITLSKHGVDVRSEIHVIKRRAMDRGPSDYVTIWIKSLCGDTTIENTMSFEPSERYTEGQFATDLQSNRERFAEELAAKVVGVAPPNPEYWFVSVWNQDEPEKRMNGRALTDESLPHTLVMREVCDVLTLPDTGNGLKKARMKVISKTFDLEVQPCEMPIPVVIGSDLIAKVRDHAAENQNKPVHEGFYTPMAEAVSAHQRARNKTVLVIGSYAEQGIQRLRRIENFLIDLEYEPVLIVDYPSNPESLEAKLLRFATSARFVAYEASISSGAIDELKMCKDNRIVIAALHETGKMATAMQSDYGIDHNFIKFFEYEPAALKEVLRNAAIWAERIIYERSEHYQNEMEMRRYR